MCGLSWPPLPQACALPGEAIHPPAGVTCASPGPAGRGRRGRRGGRGAPRSPDKMEISFPRYVSECNFHAGRWVRGRRESPLCATYISLQPGGGKGDAVGRGGGRGRRNRQPGCGSDNKQVWLGELPISAAALAGYSRLLCCLLRGEGGAGVHQNPPVGMAACASRPGVAARSGLWTSSCRKGGREEGRICGLPTYISVEVG